MKKFIFLPFMLLLAMATNALSQTPVPDPDTVGSPIQEGDPAIDAMPPGLDYVEDKKRIKAEELPDAVRETLESDTRYKDWKDAIIFHDRNTDEYLVEFTKADKTMSYRFDKEGKPIIQKQ